MTGSDNTASSLTVTSSPSVTWTVGVGLTFGSADCRIVYHYYATSPGSITVTVSGGGASTYQDVRVVTAIPTSQPGVSTTLSPNSTTVFSAALTPTRTGSLVYGMGVVGFGSGALTVIAGFTSLNTQLGSVGYFASGKAYAGSPVSTSYGFTSASSQTGAVVFLEILPLPPSTPPNNFVPMIRSAFI